MAEDYILPGSQLSDDDKLLDALQEWVFWGFDSLTPDEVINKLESELNRDLKKYL